MKYMVIEAFKSGKLDEIYKRHDDHGRMLPDGLVYLDSWLTEDGCRCFQLMQAESIEVFNEWIAKWNDLMDFEVIPVNDSPTKAPNQSLQGTP